jgi:hypothetical protein
MALSPQALETRRKLRDDFPFYAQTALKIRTKALKIEPLVLNDAQRILQEAIDGQVAAKLPVRCIILKARQQGLSTHVGGYMYFQVSQRKGAKALVVAHKADSTGTLFDMTKRFHANVPEMLRPHTSYSSRKELVFDKLDSSYTVATAGGDSIARGETITHLHASELAFWAPSTAKENWNGLRQSVPEVPGTAIFIESTANGVTGVFYDLWKGAVAGTNGYTPVFIPWYLDKGYRAEVPEGFTRTPEEEKLVEQFGIDNAQLAWRRRKIAENGLDLFKQEYPATPDEAFLTSGRPVFNPEQITELLTTAARDPLYRMAWEETEWRKHIRGELAVYIEKADGEVYFIGADVGGGGRTGDWSVAQVLDRKGRQVAVLRTQVHPDYFGLLLVKLGEFYNMAQLCPENNNHGILTCHVIAKEHDYPYIYTEIQHDKISDKETVKLGFSTNVRTKPMVVDQLRAKMRDGELQLFDRATLEEMLTYVVTESGKMEAEEGCFDDCVMSLALAAYINEGDFTPVENLKDFYVEMI